MQRSSRKSRWHMSALARVRKAKAPLLSQIRNKKTDCPSHFTLVLQIPTQKQHRAAGSEPYLLTHCGVLKLDFNHNHPIHAAHTLSFRDVSTDIKKELCGLFEMGRNAVSARHAYEQRILLESSSLAGQQTVVADRAFNPIHKISVACLTNGELKAMVVMMAKVCLKNSRRL